MDLRPHDKLRLSLLLFAIVLPLLFAVFSGMVIVQDYRSTIAQAGSDMRNTAATLGEHAMRTFGEADLRMRASIAEIERLGLAPTAADEPELHRILAAAKRDLPQLGANGAMSPDGFIRASASVFPLRPIDDRDREYYAYLTAHPGAGMHVSRPVQSRSSGRWTIPVARRLDNADGSLSMIVAFGVDMAYFDQLYSSLELGYRTRLLVRRDGWIVMETPWSPGVVHHNLARRPLFRHLQSGGAGVYRAARGLVDDSPRIVGYASHAGFPVVAVASAAYDEVVQPWIMRSLQTAVLAAVSSALLLGLLRFLWLRLGDLDAARGRLVQQHEDLDSAHRRFQELVDGIDGVVWEANLPEFRFSYVSGAAHAVSGYRPEQWKDNPDFWRGVLCSGCADDGAASGAGERLVRFDPIEHQLTTPDGREVWLRTNLTRTRGRAGRSQMRGVTIDITRQKQMDARLFDAIHIDPLTKLPNRSGLVERVNHALALAQVNRSMLAIVLIDIDNFNTVNDSLGHQSGDEILAVIGERLRHCLGPTDMLARIGGDEFAVVMEALDHGALRVESMAEQITATLDRKVVAGARELHLTVSMGIAVFPRDGADFQALVRAADTALYRAKGAGRNGWQFFDRSMAQHVEQRLDTEIALRRAIRHGGFRLHYQPQRSLHDDSIVGVETLVRWDRPGVGMVAPSCFIRLAEENGTIVELGDWILRTACTQAAAWHRAGYRLRVAVNVSAVQLHQPDFVEHVRAALAHSGLRPTSLELEITESAVVDDIASALQKLHEIKALGVELALDDFGTGYSSLAYLKQMPLDRVKVDQSFIRDLPYSAGDCAIVRAILAMAGNLGLAVIAEGVETRQQLDFLRREGCDEIQGYLLSPPMIAEQVTERFLAASSAQ